jgi:uncharacterized protein (DUF427 family)
MSSNSQTRSPDRPTESVWDYPRPPAVVEDRRRVEVVLGGMVVASTDMSWRVLETSHPPTFYLPQASFVEGSLRPASGSSFCEWKGRASYWDVVAADVVAERAAWSYPAPVPGYEVLAGHVSLYPGRMDECRVGGVVVEPQAGDFYGGWITPEIVGPFKGGPGTMGW